MLDVKFIKENEKLVKTSIKNRNLKIDIDKVLSMDAERRKILQEAESLKNRKNIASDEIAKMLKDKTDASSKIAEMKDVSNRIKELDKRLNEVEEGLNKMLLMIPNVPHSSVPVGPDASHNKIARSWGEIPKFDFKPRTHVEIVELLDIIDLPRASKITGSNFILYKGQGARLERALINFMLDLHTKKHGYTEIFPPFLVNRDSMTGTGQLPKLEEDMYRLKDDDLFLIPTAEVPVTNIFRDEILDEEDLPIYYTAYTACFRREAGSYGKDTKGLIRVHQFDKVELVKFVKPETSFDELEALLKNAEQVLQLLKLPYRVVLLSTGDISFAASKCYDIELWAPGMNTHLEVSSCSNFTDFQARRANIKYRPKDSKRAEYIHTLNGSGVALARLVVAILETYQQKDGSVKVPDALVPYLDGQKLIERKS
ncbi:MAG: serine--tRNA ligase [Candidatus Omnitrophica bacterium CG07_land_8_20_14_0_80_42_15]|uniref:Serine--tRNA ligase n=1 Tax=Candidatus Aquitaenariimonas noxiae TaxID=1974741 RepID=A0A2J0L4D9_9BACT|nr:MAG: serine--tRNA ligase [Candidatus Omnitrophica bacterium CG07_land_8_20_14_0_80_42_15]